MGTFGLQTYIWNNRLKSALLLAGFPLLLLLIAFAFGLVIAAMNDPTVDEGFRDALALLPELIPVALGAALVWFAIAYVANQWIIDAVTGAHEVARTDEPRVWNLLENLCISRGLAMPTLRIVETEARNAFATGIREGRYSIAVTRGLVDTLDDAELESVLAHELTHIRNRDVQLLVICAVFVGIISLVGDLLIRMPRLIARTATSSGGSRGGWRFGGGGRSGGGKKGGGAVILILVAIAIFLLARLLAIALRFAVSRKREFLADAGAVELTKNPDAMIGALHKIDGHSAIEAPAQIRQMFLDVPHEAGFTARLFASHPSIESRIEALVQYADGRESPAASPASNASEATSRESRGPRA